MEAIQINMWAVLVAVIANFFLGFVWYTPLFGKAWAAELKFDLTVKPTSGQLMKGMAFMIIGQFFMAYVFAHNMAAWSFVPGSDKASPWGNILSASIFTWLGFYMPVDLSRVAWEKASWKLFFINTAYHFLTLLVAAIVLTYM